MIAHDRTRLIGELPLLCAATAAIGARRPASIQKSLANKPCAGTRKYIFYSHKQDGIFLTVACQCSFAIGVYVGIFLFSEKPALPILSYDGFNNLIFSMTYREISEKLRYKVMTGRAVNLDVHRL